MNKKIDFIVADPSGNITIMVITPVDRKDYKEVAQKLLDIKELKGEQVAFILPDSPKKPYPEMEMCGLEFCGNASRSFALYEALNNNPPLSSITVKVSGCDHPLNAKIDTDTGFVEMDMPVPNAFRKFTDKELSLNKGGVLVSIDGISHLILEDIAPVADTFERLKEYIYENHDPELPAFGVMFCDTTNDLMTPVVYVKDVDTTYFEGSCASGTVAASAAIAMNMPDGSHDFTMHQPEGTLHTKVIKKEGRIENIFLKGLINISDVISVILP